MFKLEPIIIKGAFSFGLKDVTRAMFRNGMLKRDYYASSTITDGRMAMIVVAQAAETGTPLTEHSVMLDVLEYNKIDVRVLYEIVWYLREHR